MIGDKHKTDIGDLGVSLQSQAQSEREKRLRRQKQLRARSFICKRFEQEDRPFPQEDPDVARDELLAMLGLDVVDDGPQLTSIYPTPDSWS